MTAFRSPNIPKFTAARVPTGHLAAGSAHLTGGACLAAAAVAANRHAVGLKQSNPTKAA
jgi:hypothetical protein